MIECDLAKDAADLPKKVDKLGAEVDLLVNNAGFGLRGRIWQRVLSKSELPEIEREHTVISTKLLAGRTVAHVYSDIQPGSSFEACEPDLEDVYFSAMRWRVA